MLMLVIFIIGTVAFLTGSLSRAGLNNKRDKITSDALSQAKDGLIGRATFDANHPGSLPCPDTNDDGVAESGSSCPNYIGRLPWITLGLPDLRDSSGERLWYALSPNFRDSSNVINSNTVGTLQVYDNTGTNLLPQTGSEAVAIIFSPGSIVASQQRDTVANRNLSQNYLDIGPNSKNNTIATGPFIAADKTNSFNDRLMVITTSDIISKIEIRVVKELSAAFAYYLTVPANNNKYPYPAGFNSCTSKSACYSDTSGATCTGKIPVTTMTSILPSWFGDNNWFDVIFYTAGTSILPGGAGGGGGGGGKWGKGKKGGGSWTGGGGGSGSTSCSSPFLTLLDSDGSTLTTSANAFIIMPGAPLSPITRTSSINTTNLTNYIEDIENTNMNSIYVMPGENSNDSLFVLP